MWYNISYNSVLVVTDEKLQGFSESDKSYDPNKCYFFDGKNVISKKYEQNKPHTENYLINEINSV